MKIVHRKWKTDKARGKRARRLTAMRKLGELMAESMRFAARRKGFGRRMLDLMEAEDKAGRDTSKLPLIKMEVTKVGPPVRPTDWHLEAGDGYYAVVPGPHPG